MKREEIEVVYRLRSDAAALASRAEALLLEQTVELPRDAVRSEFVRQHVIGRVVGTVAVGPREHEVTIAQPVEVAAGDGAQFLNVLFGNSSLQPDVVLHEVRVPPSLAGAIGGPRFGLAGWRRLTGVQGRALTAVALKPLGLSVPELAELCRDFALSGIDVAKDDHGLADHAFGPFVDRVRACLAATEAAAQQTGRRTLYVPNLIGGPAQVLEQGRRARELGVQAVMVSPMLLGLPFLPELARALDVPILAHPAFGGALRIAPPTLLGRLFPLFGADAVIYPNAGGRFAYSAEECAAIAANVRQPAAGLAALPVPAGGIRAENAADVLRSHGRDTMLLVGGSLLQAPDRAALRERTRAFGRAVAEFAYAG